MKLYASAAVVLGMLSLSLSAQQIPEGEWKAVFTGPLGDRPKMFTEITFTIEPTPTGFAGTGRAGNWPGVLTLSEIHLTGNRLTFTATGKEGWSSGQPFRYHCCPKLVFDGTLDSDEMRLTMAWQSTEQEDDPLAIRVPMKATRVAR